MKQCPPNKSLVGIVDYQTIVAEGEISGVSAMTANLRDRTGTFSGVAESDMEKLEPRVLD